jgi:hypothetical protein
MKKQLLLEKISKEEMIQHIKDYYKYAKHHLKISKTPKVVFVSDESNADDFLGKTAYYDPKTMTIHLFTLDRHPKDIVRSFAHELIHHFQNLNEKLPDEILNHTHEIDYASKNKDLRDMEREAYEKGNMMFRDWTDSIKSKRNKTMNETKHLTKTQLKKKDKIAKKIPTHTKSGKKVNPYAVADTIVHESQCECDECWSGGDKGIVVSLEQEKQNFPAHVSYEKAKKLGVKEPKKADVKHQGDLEGWEVAKALQIQKTKQRKMQESHDLQKAEPKLEKILTKQERELNNVKTGREQIVYNELMRRILKQDK